MKGQTTSLLPFQKPQPIHLQAGELASFRIPLQKGQMAAVSILQASVGVGYAVYAPGKQLILFEDLNGLFQKEKILIRAHETGPYTLNIFWDYGRPQQGDILVRWDSVMQVPADKKQKANQMISYWYPAHEPGMAMAVLQDNKLIYQQVRGMANMEERVPLTTASNFELASVSKQFTGYAIALLVAQGKLSLKDKIGTYFPELPPYKEQVTVEHLVYHTSGIQDWDDILYYMGMQPTDLIQTPLILEMAKASPDLLFTPGERFAYSNTNYNLLAILVERVSGQPFANWMQEHVFRPAGMIHTYIRDADLTLIPRKAFAYRATANGFRQAADHISAYGSTSVHSNLQDLVRWVQFLNKPESMPPGVAPLLTRPTILNDGKPYTGYAFGNGMETDAKGQFIQHLGSVSGYRSMIARHPSEGISIIFMSNDHNDASFIRARLLADVFLGRDTVRNIEPFEFPDLKESLEATMPFGPVANQAPLPHYAGVYLQEQLGSVFTILVSGGYITAINNRKDSIHLRLAGKDLFISNSPLMTHGFQFHLEPSGEVSGFTLKGGEKDMYFRKLR